MESSLNRPQQYRNILFCQNEIFSFHASLPVQTFYLCKNLLSAASAHGNLRPVGQSQDTSFQLLKVTQIHNIAGMAAGKRRP